MNSNTVHIHVELILPESWVPSEIEQVVPFDYDRNLSAYNEQIKLGSSNFDSIFVTSLSATSFGRNTRNIFSHNKSTYSITMKLMATKQGDIMVMYSKRNAQNVMSNKPLSQTLN